MRLRSRSTRRLAEIHLHGTPTQEDMALGGGDDHPGTRNEAMQPESLDG